MQTENIGKRIEHNDYYIQQVIETLEDGKSETKFHVTRPKSGPYRHLAQIPPAKNLADAKNAINEIVAAGTVDPALPKCPPCKGTGYLPAESFGNRGATGRSDRQCPDCEGSGVVKPPEEFD